MTIGENLDTFFGREVEDFSPGKPIDPQKAPRVRLDWDAFEAGATLVQNLEALLEDPAAAELDALVIGAWDFESSHSASEWIPFLCESAPRLPKIRALMLGDLTFEEQEISWIQQGNVGPVLQAYPALRHLQVRGGEGLDLDPPHHQSLETLIVETGGLSRSILARLSGAELPELVHLELWLGSPAYGYDATEQDLLPLFEANRFPRLRRLGLRNAENADDVARALAGSPILEQLQVLDMSMGTLGDEGVRALLADERLRRLQRLDVHHHYLGRESIDELMALGIEIDASEVLEEEEGERYCSVAE